MRMSRKLINILLALQLLTLYTIAAGQDSESQTAVSEDPPVVHKRKHPAAAARFAEDDAERYNLLKESAAVGAASVNGIHEDAWTPEHVLTFIVPPGLDKAVKLFQHIDAAGEGDIIRGNVITASSEDRLDMTISQPGKDNIWSGRDLEEGSWKFFALQGDYELRFINPGSSEIQVTLAWRVGDSPDSDSAVLDSREQPHGQLDEELVVMAGRVHAELDLSIGAQEHLSKRNSRGYVTQTTTNTRIQALSILEGLVVIGCVVLQIWYLRSLNLGGSKQRSRGAAASLRGYDV